MHDIRWIRDHPADFDRGLARRGFPPRAAEVLMLDRAWRAAETGVQEARSRRNRIARDIGAAKKRGENIEPLLSYSTYLLGQRAIVSRLVVMEIIRWCLSKVTRRIE